MVLSFLFNFEEYEDYSLFIFYTKQILKV